MGWASAGENKLGSRHCCCAAGPGERGEGETRLGQGREHGVGRLGGSFSQSEEGEVLGMAAAIACVGREEGEKERWACRWEKEERRDVGWLGK